MTHENELINYKRMLAGYACALLVTVLLLGSSSNYMYKSVEDCILAKIQNNAALYQVGLNACTKEFEHSLNIISNKSQKDEELIKKLIKEGYAKTAIYEYFAKQEYELLSEDSLSRGWVSLTSTRDDRLINSLRGLFLGLGFALVVGGFYIFSKSKK